MLDLQGAGVKKYLSTNRNSRANILMVETSKKFVTCSLKRHMYWFNQECIRIKSTVFNFLGNFIHMHLRSYWSTADYLRLFAPALQ